jgi:predicted phosphodiesterase
MPDAAETRLGLISDIHGNRVALDAVLADGNAQGVEQWWILGDLVAIGPAPIATLETLASIPNVRFVRGNTDRYVLTGDRPPPHASDVVHDPSLRPLFDAVEASFAWTHDVLAPTVWLDWLAGLPTEQRLVLADGTRLLGVHASATSDDGAGIAPDTPDDTLRTTMSGADADLVCGGHTHRITDRVLDGVRFVNLGSVSNPVTTDLRASYLIIDDDADGHRVAHRRVAYDHARVIDELRESTHPQADYIAGFQRGAEARYPGT